MTTEVPKVIGSAVLGTPADTLTVAKVVGFVIYSPEAAPAAPQVRKKVSVRGRIIYLES